MHGSAAHIVQFPLLGHLCTMDNLVYCDIVKELFNILLLFLFNVKKKVHATL